MPGIAQFETELAAKERIAARGIHQVARLPKIRSDGSNTVLMVQRSYDEVELLTAREDVRASNNSADVRRHPIPRISPAKA